MNTSNSNLEVILVNSKDEQVGTAEKIYAHKEGLLHRAFSVFVFNSKHELLLQQRSNAKYHCGGLWTNTCCSHPYVGKSTINAAKERLSFEMGIKAELSYAGVTAAYKKST